MKIFKPLLTSLIFLLISTTGQAQFFEKLLNKAEKKIESEAEKRAERRVNNKIDKTFDGAEDTIDGKNKSSKKDINIPNTYDFNWKYTLQMTTKEGDVKINYLLKQDASYFGMIMDLGEKTPTRNSVTIMDMDRNAFITIMDVNGQKMVRTTKIPNLNTQDKNTKEFELIKTDTKVILGYNCQGFKTQMDDGVMHFYVAKNAPVSFNRAFGNTQNMPKGFNEKIRKEFENGIMLEAEFIHDKKKKKNFKTICIALEKNNQTINTIK